MLITELAAKDAGEILAEYWDERCFPVDPTAIAQAMGLNVTELQLDDDTSGVLVALPNRVPEIYLESRDVPQRQRFTCAHELGHYVERSNAQTDSVEGYSFVDKRTSKRDVHEFYADEFAGNLLMPEPEVRRLERAGRGIVGMSAHFGVSLPAMEVRLRRLNIELVRGSR